MGKVTKLALKSCLGKMTDNHFLEVKVLRIYLPTLSPNYEHFQAYTDVDRKVRYPPIYCWSPNSYKQSTTSPLLPSFPFFPSLLSADTFGANSRHFNISFLITFLCISKIVPFLSEPTVPELYPTKLAVIPYHEYNKWPILLFSLLTIYLFESRYKALTMSLITKSLKLTLI